MATPHLADIRKKGTKHGKYLVTVMGGGRLVEQDLIKIELFEGPVKLSYFRKSNIAYNLIDLSTELVNDVLSCVYK